tara:strand:- start:352 stop:720 length:369 start_codon:yes stop_codon:yes gene_type:complete
MGFKKGNKFGKGRPVGSHNQLTKANKEFLHNLLFNEEQLLQDFADLDLNGRMELRTRLAPYILPKAAPETEKYEDGPLFIDEPPIKKMWPKWGLITPNEPDYYFTFDQLMLDIKNDTLKIEK